jgi:hypothetical protein
MQSWQLISIVFVAGIFGLTFFLRGRMKGQAGSFFSGSMSAFRTEVAQHRLCP